MGDNREWVNKFVELLAGETTAGLGVEAALALKHMNLPKRIYKFRSDSDNARDNLLNDTVWLSSPESFNDPYDCSAKISFESVITGVLRSAIDEMVAKFGLDSALTAEDIEAVKQSDAPHLRLSELLLEKMDADTAEKNREGLEFVKSLTPFYEKAMTSQVGQSHRNSLKVCSFTEINDSIIMWSLYGDQHRGFCIEYDLEGLPPSNLNGRFLCPVVYSAALFDATKYYLAAVLNRTTFNILFPMLPALHKSPEWKHEKEWRLVIMANMVKEESNWRMIPAKRLYLGSLMPAAKRDALIGIARQKKIEVFQMHLAKDSFTLIPELIAIP
jgi:hypothetical protein